MNITYKVKMDLVRDGIAPKIDVPQGDAESRIIKIALYEEGVEWTVPTVDYAIIRYSKPDGTGGEYTVLPSGATACTISGNVLSVILAAQTLTVPGCVNMDVSLIQGDVILSTFSIIINVKANATATQSENYKYVPGFIPMPLDAEEGKYIKIKKTDTDGTVLETEAEFVPSEAKDLAYDNSGSGLKATTVQEAIDESSENHDNLKKKVSKLSSENETLAKATDILDRTKADAIVCEASGETIAVSDASDDYLRGLKLYGKTTQDGTPTPDSPVELVSVGSGGSLGVKVHGKNLLPWGTLSTAQSLGGGQYTTDIRYAESLTFSADVTKYADDSATNTRIGIRVEYVDGESVNRTSDFDTTNAERDGVTRKKTLTVSIDPKREIRQISCWALDYGSPGDTRNAKAENIQLELGSVATDYEPYTSQTIIAQTPNGLPGIPVTSGGNYTDTDGQQWICDEVDFERGVYVQNTRLVTFDGTEGWSKNTDYNVYSLGELTSSKLNGFYTGEYWDYCNLLCNQYKPILYVNNNLQPDATITAFRGTMGESIKIKDDAAASVDDWKTQLAEMFANGSPLQVLIPLSSSVKAVLTDEELKAFDALHTNKPNTTVLNDGGAYMELAYNADAKTYIDNKFAELTAAIVSLGGNV